MGVQLKYVSVSNDGSHVWGVDNEGNFHYRNGKGGSWQYIFEQKLKQVSVSGNGEHVWGVNSADEIFYRNGRNGVWTKIDGYLKHVSVSNDGSHVWGVNSEYYVYYRNGNDASQWEPIPGRLKQVDVSGDGGHIWGVNTSDIPYYRADADPDQPWTKKTLPGNVKIFEHIFMVAADVWDRVYDEKIIDDTLNEINDFKDTGLRVARLTEHLHCVQLR